MVRKLHPARVLYDLKSIKGYFHWVPKDTAPDKDKGVYFEKAINYLDSKIREYEIKVENYNKFKEVKVKI